MNESDWNGLVLAEEEEAVAGDVKPCKPAKSSSALLVSVRVRVCVSVCVCVKKK